jgi:hypothetical protein
MFRSLLTTLLAVFKLPSSPRSPKQTGGESLLQDAQYMSPESQRFVRRSVAAWNALDESERHVPTSL